MTLPDPQSRPPGGGLHLLLAKGLLVLFLGAPGAGAQEIEGPLSPAGLLRIGVAPEVRIADHRFGRRVEEGNVVEPLEPLGFDLSHPRAGSTFFPPLSTLEEDLRAAVDDPDLAVSLGRTRARIETSVTTVPLQVDLGLTEWLTIGITAPLVRRRSEVEFVIAADSVTADLGVSPGIEAPGETGAFLTSLEEAVEEMAAQAETICESDPGSAECADAEDAAAEGGTFLAALDRAYDASFFPFTGSDTGGALRARLGLLGSRFESHGVTSTPGPANLPLAEGPLSAPEFHRVVSDPTFGVAGVPLGTWQSLWELGDVEVRSALRLAEGAPPEGAGSFEGPYYLLGVGGMVRFGTGTPSGPDNFVDVGSGDGQTDVEVRAFGDLGFARRMGIWADARYGVQLEGELVRRIAAPDVVLAPLDRRATVRRDPGDYLDLEVAPRIRLTPELALAGRYRYWSKGSDRYELAAGNPAELPDPALLEEETAEVLHEAGISLVYSTVAATEAGRAGRPLEARFRYRRAVAGSGGRTPRWSRFEVGLRLFWELWGDRNQTGGLPERAP